jgi:hypothetical protein
MQVFASLETAKAVADLGASPLKLFTVSGETLIESLPAIKSPVDIEFYFDPNKSPLLLAHSLLQEMLGASTGTKRKFSSTKIVPAKLEPKLLEDLKKTIKTFPEVQSASVLIEKHKDKSMLTLLVLSGKEQLPAEALNQAFSIFIASNNLPYDSSSLVEVGPNDAYNYNSLTRKATILF